MIKWVLRLLMVLAWFSICIIGSDIWGGEGIHLPANSSLMTARNIFLVLMRKIPGLVHMNLLWTASLALQCELSIPFRWYSGFEWNCLKIEDNNTGKMSVCLDKGKAASLDHLPGKSHTKHEDNIFLILLQSSK